MLTLSIVNGRWFRSTLSYRTHARSHTLAHVVCRAFRKNSSYAADAALYPERRQAQSWLKLPHSADIPAAILPYRPHTVSLQV